MAVSLETKNAVRQILLDMGPYLDERQRRMLYGSAAVVLGRGGISFVNEVTGSARNTIAAGKAEIASTEEEELAVGGPGRVRRPGAGRKSARQKNPELYDKIEEIIPLAVGLGAQIHTVAYDVADGDYKRLEGMKKISEDTGAECLEVNTSDVVEKVLRLAQEVFILGGFL